MITVNKVERDGDCVLYPEGYFCNNFLTDCPALRILETAEKIIPQVFTRLRNIGYTVKLWTESMFRTFVIVMLLPTEADRLSFEESIKQEFRDHPLQVVEVDTWKVQNV
jgi:hypothetical protein